MSTDLFHVHKHQTREGLALRVVPMEGTSTATLMILVGTGSRHEIASQSGISHFLEHIFFKGSKKRPTTRMISEAIDGVGGEFNAFTSKEMTAFYAKTGSEHAELTTDVLSDMLIRPLFDAKEIDRERGVIIEEMNMYEDMPAQAVGEYWEELLYERHPLGRKIIGTKDIISTVPRDTFLSYIGRQYSTKNTIVCLTGNVDPEKSIALLSRAFSSFHRGTPKKPTPFSGTWGKKRVHAHAKQTDQAHVIVGGLGVSLTHPDRPAVDVMSAILGGGMSSRLFIEVRERRGLAYSVHTSTEHFTDTGYVATQAGVDPSKLTKAVEVILKEYGKIRTKRVPNGELTKVKESLKGRLLMRLESSDAVAQYVGAQEVLTGRVLPLSDVLTRIDGVSAADVQRVAKKLLAPSVLRIAAVAPDITSSHLLALLS